MRDAVEQEIQNQIQAGMLSHFFSIQSANGLSSDSPARARILRGFPGESPKFQP
jgi:hypothetical protein